MFNESLELSDVLARLKRADESLAEFVAPLWPGVKLAAAWIEGKARLFRIEEIPADEGYYLLAIGEDADTAAVARPAEDDEVRKYLGYLTKASVILLDDEFAYPASAIERLQGITGVRPIHFAQGQPLAQVQARFDGVNLLFDGARATKTADNPLEELFGFSTDAVGDNLLDLFGEKPAGDDAGRALEELRAHPEASTELRLTAVLDSAGAVLEEWSRTDDGIRLRWRRGDETCNVALAHANAPIVSGISLAGARGFDPASLIHLLHAHLLDAWR